MCRPLYAGFVAWVAILCIACFVGMSYSESLVWNANAESDILGYRVYTNSTADMTSFLLLQELGEYQNNSEDVTTTDTCVPLDTSCMYQYLRVTAVDTTLNESEFSDYVFFDPYPDIPLPPSGLRIEESLCSTDFNRDGAVTKLDSQEFNVAYRDEKGRTDCCSWVTP